MEHDVQRTARLGVNPTHFGWLNGGGPKMQPSTSTEQMALEMQGLIKKEKPKSPRVEKVRPGKGRVFLGIVFLFIASVSYPVIIPMFKANMPVAMLIVALGLIVAVIPFKVRALALIPLAYVVYCLFTIEGFTLNTLPPLLMVSMFVAAAVWGIILPFKRVPKRVNSTLVSKPKKGKSAPSRHPYRFVYGRPGGVGSSASKFGEAAVSAGVAGEESTAYLLETFLKNLPGVTIFHGLTFPGSRNADVDHAVLAGNHVFLIDSKQYKSGEYQWYPTTGGEKIGTSYLDAKTNHMDSATASYRKMLGSGVTVTSLLIIHGREIQIGSRRWSPSRVGAFNAHEGLGFIGSSISSRSKTEQNAYALDVLISNLKN